MSRQSQASLVNSCFQLTITLAYPAAESGAGTDPWTGPTSFRWRRPDRAGVFAAFAHSVPDFCPLIKPVGHDSIPQFTAAGHWTRASRLTVVAATCRVLQLIRARLCRVQPTRHNIRMDFPGPSTLVLHRLQADWADFLRSIRRCPVLLP